jgi:hypothetical protein
LFKDLKILKVQDNIFLQNCLFVHDYFHGNLPVSFYNTFAKVENLHSICTRTSNDGKLVKQQYNSTKYGLNSIYNLCISNWNKLTDIIKQNSLDNDITLNPHNLTRINLKKHITNHFIESYI